MIKIPCFHIYIYATLRKKHGVRVVDKKTLKECLYRTLVNKPGVYGGNRKGLPSSEVQEVINELCYYKLIKKINYNRYEILRNSNARIKKWIFLSFLLLSSFLSFSHFSTRHLKIPF